ncbi:MAG: FG-GAP-like repeat-containing protein [Candidatus Promineifilaceae bacterium]|nr:FG-GAP-like repeat-containing protein [Candidatus Promineifilaceae bacterium]
MLSTKVRKVRVVLLTVVLLLVIAGTAAAASPYFVEPDVAVLHTVSAGNSGWFGWVAENLGDVNDDGVDDFITSDPFFTSASGPAAGAIYILSGADGVIVQSHEGDAGTALGYSATRAGDVDGDGVGDYVAGAPFGDRALVYSGADHSVLLDLAGPAGSGFGASVATAGDIDGDGLSDILVGADRQDAGAGATYLYSGATGSLIRTHGGPAGGHMGTALGKIGDVDGDGVPDYVVGARSAGEQGRGEAYAFSGASGQKLYTMTPVGQEGTAPFGDFSTFALFFASGAGDVNGDGVPDIFIGDYYAKRGDVSRTGRAYVFSGTNGHRIKVLQADEQGDGFGPGRGIGDVDGDGHADLILGAYAADDGATWGGMVTLVSGRNGQAMRTFTGAQPWTGLGVDVLSAGDLNGDGVQDYLLTGFGVVFFVAG